MSELAERLKESSIKLTSRHIGLVDVKVSTGNYLQDKWEVTVSYNEKSYTTEYSAGIGHRKQSSSVQKDRNGFYNKISGDFKNERDACDAGWLKPIAPNLPDVLSCLLLDARCAEGTFEDFCDEMGYDQDSIKALGIYLEYQKTKNEMTRMLGMKLFEELSQLEH